jgi:hypothetical protein
LKIGLDIAVGAHEKSEFERFYDDVVLDSLIAFSFYKVSEDEKLSAIADGALKCFSIDLFVVVISWLNCNLIYRVMDIAKDSMKNIHRIVSQERNSAGPSTSSAPKGTL